MSNTVRLAEQIATAVTAKLNITDRYMVAVRRHAEPCPMPWIEIALCLKGKPPETHEFCVSLPEYHYDCKDKEERSAIAQYVYKTISMMIGKLDPKGK